ncbi:uncharacterized protein LOC144568070 [Carex rostrata]
MMNIMHATVIMKAMVQEVMMAAVGDDVPSTYVESQNEDYEPDNQHREQPRDSTSGIELKETRFKNINELTRRQNISSYDEMSNLFICFFVLSQRLVCNLLDTKSSSALRWGIKEEEKVRNYYYQKMATYHRRWRTEMTKTASKIGKENQAKNEYPHFLGSRGYMSEGFRSRLTDAMQTIADEKTSSDPSSQGSTSALKPEEVLDMSIEHRHVTWRLGRQKLDKETKERFYPETYVPVIEKIEEQEAALKKGLLAVERYDDVLGKSLPNPEHPGRVRGVGGLVPIRKTYEKSSIRRRRAPSSSEAKMREELREEMEDKVREIEVRLEAKMREEMKSQLALLVQQSMGQQVQTFTPTVLQSSSQSVKPIADLSGYTEEAEISCKLQAAVNGNTVTVAVGTIHVLVAPGGTIHGRPMPLDHARVIVDDSITASQSRYTLGRARINP